MFKLASSTMSKPVNRQTQVRFYMYDPEYSLEWHPCVIFLYEKPFRVHMGNESARLGEI